MAVLRQTGPAKLASKGAFTPGQSPISMRHSFSRISGKSTTQAGVWLSRSFHDHATEATEDTFRPAEPIVAGI
jgi:hypothetical protein